MGCSCGKTRPKLLTPDGSEPEIAPPENSWAAVENPEEHNAERFHFDEVHITLSGKDYSIYPSGGTLPIKNPKVFDQEKLENAILPCISCDKVHIWDVNQKEPFHVLLEQLSGAWDGMGIKEVIVNRPGVDVYPSASNFGLSARPDDGTVVLRKRRTTERMVGFKVPNSTGLDPAAIAEDWKKLATGRGLDKTIYTPILIVSHHAPDSISLNFQTAKNTERVAKTSEVLRTINMVKCHCFLILCSDFGQDTILRLLGNPPQFKVVHFLGRNDRLNFPDIIQKITESSDNREIEIMLESIKPYPILSQRMIDYLDFNEISATEIRYMMEDSEEVKLLNSIGLKRKPSRDSVEMVNMEYLFEVDEDG